MFPDHLRLFCRVGLRRHPGRPDEDRAGPCRSQLVGAPDTSTGAAPSASAMNTRSVRAVISWRQANGGYARDPMVPGTRGRVPEPGPPGLEGPGTRSTPTCIRTTPRSGQSRESAKAGGPADTVIEAAGADPFGDCQVEGSLIGALRACGNLDAALSRAEAASRERPADTLIGSASAGSSRGSGVARESGRERRDAVGGSTRVRTSLYRGVVLTRLGVLDDPGERCGGDRVSKDHRSQGCDLGRAPRRPSLVHGCSGRRFSARQAGV